MSNHVLISCIPEDGQVAATLAGDLERQGVRTFTGAGNEPALYSASAMVTLLGPMSAASPLLRADAERAAAAGKPIHAVRLGHGGDHALAGIPVLSWTDAFGPDAQANVAGLGQGLRASGAMAPPPHHGPAPYPGAPGYGHGQPRRKPIGLTIAGSVVGGIVALVGLLEALEVINIFPTRDSPSSSYSSTNTSAGMTGGSPTSTSTSSLKGAAATAAAATASDGVLRYEWIHGTWGPGCPSSRVGAVTLNNNVYNSGIYSSAQGSGTWVITTGNTLTTTDSAGRRENSIWTPEGLNQASVTVPGVGTRTLYRC